MRYGVLPAVLAAALLLGGCAHEAAPTPPPAESLPALHPKLDVKAAPAVAVLALAPTDAASVAVTDFDQVRLDLGLPEVTDASPAADKHTFWRRAKTERPLLSDGMLRPYDATLSQTYGFSSLDVAWEAQFVDSSGQKSGWVLAFRHGTDLAAVQRAVTAGVGPLAGGTVDAANDLVTSGAASDPAHSWAAERSTADLTQDTPADSTYLDQSCTTSTTGDTGADLERLGPWSVAFQDSLVTAQLGSDRMDLFTRMRLGSAQPAFAAAYDDGVADPQTGRIGYHMVDPASAAKLALQGQLPFTACS